MKTIEEHNKEAIKSEVMSYSFEYTPEWVPMGIMCPCGCKKELLEEKWPITHRRKYVKCQETGRGGRMVYSDGIRLVIKGVEWDKAPTSI